MHREDLIKAVSQEMDRVWGEEGFGGSDQEYEWLLEHYDIAEEEDLVWLEVLQDFRGDLNLDDPEAGYGDDEKAEIELFLDDDRAVCRFLELLLEKLRTGAGSYSE
jgi:hypothetical protein